VGVVVVAPDVAVAGTLIHRDGLDEGAVGVQPYRGVTEVGGHLLEGARERGAETRAAPARVHPHPLDLADPRLQLLNPATGHGLAVAGGDHESARTGSHVLVAVVVA